jgi:hypothetical protein
VLIISCFGFGVCSLGLELYRADLTNEIKYGPRNALKISRVDHLNQLVHGHNAKRSVRWRIDLPSYRR